DRQFLFLNLATLRFYSRVVFEELVQQHCVYGVVAHSVRYACSIASYDGVVDLFHFLGHEAKLRKTLGIKLFLVKECDWLKREDRFACLVHWLDLRFETLRGGCRAKLAGSVYFNGNTHYSCSIDTSDEGFCLGSLCTYPDRVGLGSNTLVPYIDIVVPRGEIAAGRNCPMRCSGCRLC